MTASRQLAEFAAGLALTSLPADVQESGRRTMANVIGLSVGASQHEALRAARRVLEGVGGTPHATILGLPGIAPAWSAAFLNGMAAHVEDFDDTHLETVLHPGAPVVPAALAMAELIGATSQDLVAGVIAGVEVGSRVALALGKSHFDRGWHVTGTAGHVAAAVAAARVARLGSQEILTAMGLGATSAAGLQEALGTSIKSVHPGKAAADGVEAALLASEGWLGPNEPLEGRRGLVALANGAGDWDRALRGLGREWEVTSNAFKPYACGIVSHPVIDLAVAIGREFDRDPSAIQAVEVTVNPVVLDVMGVKDPQTGLQSKFSVYHCFAVGYLEGVAGPAQYSDARAVDPIIRALRAKVSVVLDHTIAADECRGVVTGPNGKVHRHVAHAIGSVDSPLSNADLRAKVVLVAGPVLGENAAGRLFDVTMELGQRTSLGDLITVATPSVAWGK
jgi:2-methylcitrate dehydratase PrpD